MTERKTGRVDTLVEHENLRVMHDLDWDTNEEEEEEKQRSTPIDLVQLTVFGCSGDFSLGRHLPPVGSSTTCSSCIACSSLNERCAELLIKRKSFRKEISAYFYSIFFLLTRVVWAFHPVYPSVWMRIGWNSCMDLHSRQDAAVFEVEWLCWTSVHWRPSVDRRLCRSTLL